MIATFGAGCFWKPQHEFDKVKGVIKTKVGFMGGDKKNPSYEQVCTGKTKHAEVVQIEFDPKIISFEKLLEIFWEILVHNKQGLDIGSQYRNVIFYHSEEQKEIAEFSKEKRIGKIVTEIFPATEFYEAENYHQKYLEKNKGFRC